MPRQREMLWKDFTPKGWGAVCKSSCRGGITCQKTDKVIGELLGGEDRIDPTLFHKVGDGLIINLGAEEWRDVRRYHYVHTSVLMQINRL